MEFHSESSLVSTIGVTSQGGRHLRVDGAIGELLNVDSEGSSRDRFRFKHDGKSVEIVALPCKLNESHSFSHH